MAYSTGQEAKQVRGPSIVGSIEDLDPVINRANDYKDRLQKIVDRICGSGPQELVKPNGVGAGIPHSVIASINERRSHLVDILDAFERSLNQLENVL